MLLGALMLGQLCYCRESPDYEVFTRIMYTFTFSHFFIHIFGCFLMTLNRYMAVCHPLSYKKYWRTRAVNIMLFVEIFLSIVVHTHLFLVELGYQCQNNKWVYIGRLEPIPVSEFRYLVKHVAFSIIRVLT
ncbi:hypothetical protein Y032_0025g1158 [Ancylostoma ceylanicum]|uniref:G-protein coupled receptors family 1 profile domain-containing protein n=1 Tax=Ancylostoma ceylanicum TaxID=53326 RepID=A0A016UXA1_9BILA|nr:hypothetical protein Y032_0025g1158 [Ancylostoma ceylanicum]